MKDKDKKQKDQINQSYNKDFMKTGNEVSEIANSIRRKNAIKTASSATQQVNTNTNDSSKKKKLIILIVLLTLLIGAGVAAAVLLTSSSRTEIEFRLNNIDARILVECNIMNPNGDNKEVLVNGQSQEIITISPEQVGENNTISKVLQYDEQLEINEGDTVRFEYTIQNMSSKAGMYIDFSKANSQDYNFKIQVRYQIQTESEKILLTNYAGGEDKLYYSSIENMNNNIGGVVDIATQDAIYLPHSKLVKIIVEMSIIDYGQDASCNCNHIFDLVNENSR